MLRELPKDYFIYETPFNSEIPCKQLFVHYFDALPSSINLKENIIKYTKSKPYINNLTNIL